MSREPEATAEALGRRKDGLGSFATILRQVADAREGGWGTEFPAFTFGRTSPAPTSELAAQIADAPAPFWRHVRDALAERHP